MAQPPGGAAAEREAPTALELWPARRRPRADVPVGGLSYADFAPELLDAFSEDPLLDDPLLEDPLLDDLSADLSEDLSDDVFSEELPPSEPEEPDECELEEECDDEELLRLSFL